MRSSVYVFLTLLVIIPRKSTISGLTFSEFAAMNIPYATSFSCNDNRRKQCRCEDNCIRYGDCCLNAPAYDPQLQVRNMDIYKCVSGKYMKTDCLEGWKNRKVFKLCGMASPNDISNSRDPLISLPVTSNDTFITYPNYYCAICNNDAQHLHTWNVNIICYFNNNPSMFDEDNLKRKIEAMLHFEGWTEYDLDKQFNYTSWQNYNMSAYSILVLFHMVAGNTGVKEYIKSNLFFSETYNQWAFAIEQNGEKAEFNCKIFPYGNSNVARCEPAVRACAVDWYDKVTENLCRSYISLVEVSDTTYRNFHCAICNHIPAEYIGNFQIVWHYNPGYFLALISVPDSPVSSCEDNKTYFPGYCQSQNVMCRISSEVHSNGICLDINPSNSSFINNTDNNVAEVFKNFNQMQTLSSLSIAQINNSSCEKVFIDDRDLSLLDNGTISLNSGHIYKDEEYTTVEGGILVCFRPSQFLTILSWVSFAGIIVSIAGLGLYLSAFLLLVQFRNLPGKNLASLSVCLLTAYIIFIISPSVTPQTTGCYVLASLLYFSFFASFCWMNVISFDTWQSFRRATLQLQVRSGDQWHKFLAYSLYSWLLSITALIALVTTDQTSPQGLPSQYLPQLGQRMCWFGQNKALLLFFVGPLFTSTLLNAFFFIGTMWLLFKTDQSLSQVIETSFNRQRFTVHVRLAVLMGVTWVSSIIAWYLENEVMWYIFVILNTLQGTFIFMAFACHRQVWLDILKVCGCLPLKKEQTLPQEANECHLSRNTQYQYTSPRLELLHVSTSVDRMNQPSRLQHNDTFSTDNF